MVKSFEFKVIQDLYAKETEESDAVFVGRIKYKYFCRYFGDILGVEEVFDFDGKKIKGCCKIMLPEGKERVVKHTYNEIKKLLLEQEKENKVSVGFNNRQ